MSSSLITEKVDKILFTNGEIVDPVKLTREKGSVLVEDGKLTAAGNIDPGSFDGKTVDISGKIICPGLIDMHVHLREPGREDEETVETGADAAMAGGFVSVASMPNTEPAADSAEVIRFLKNC